MKRQNLIGCGVVITLVLAGGAARADWTPPESSVTPPAVVSVSPFTRPGWNGVGPHGPLVVGPDGALYGSTGNGGAYNPSNAPIYYGEGTLFRVETNGTFTKLHDFNYTDGAYPSAALVVGPDGALYGSAESGGTNGYGTLFRLTTDGTFTKLHDFNYTDGAGPYAALVVGPDGALYGSAAGGGVYNGGTLFRLTTDGTFTKLDDLYYPTVGTFPTALVAGPDSALYGATDSGGAHDDGTLFRLATDGTITKLHDFSYQDGHYPKAALVVGPDGALYGSADLGGAYTNGTLFRVETNGTFTKLHDFNGTDGSAPGPLVVGSDGALYGSAGDGAYTNGTLFRVETNGTFTKLHDFNGTDGSVPGPLVVGSDSPLVVGSDGALYGSAGGGAYTNGTLFRVEANGTFTTLHDFNGRDLESPSTLVVGPDGALYGSTYGRLSTPSDGTLFRLTTDGTFTMLYDFYDSVVSNPHGALAVGPDGALYGSAGGGVYNSGALFRLTTDGTFTTLHDLYYPKDGTSPTALVAGPDGALYGATGIGGAYNYGTLFRLTTNGTFTKLQDFDKYLNGAYPLAAMVVGPDGALYGSTPWGGAYNGGTVFRLTTDGTFTDLHDSNDGTSPTALVVGPDGALYGSTYSGGANNAGTLFRLTVNGTFTKLHDFVLTNGEYPSALVVGPDGALYGATAVGGISYYNGTLFRVTTNGIFTKLHDFNGTDGNNGTYGYVPGTLVVGPDGALYGSTGGGGISNNGTLFRLTTDGTFTKVHDFTGTDGSYPSAALVVGPDGALYGSAGGSTSSNGVLFRLTTDGTFTTLSDFAGTNGVNPSVALVVGPDGDLYGSTPNGGPRDGGVLFKLVLDHTPVADASATPTLVFSPNGTNATVLLDGSLSSDPNGHVLQFTWYNSGTASPLANGVVALSVLPVGTNSLRLMVNDGQLADTNSVTIAVMTATGAVTRLVDLLNTDPSAAQTFATTLTAALTSIDRADPASAINQLVIFQNQVQAQVQPLDSALAASLIQTAQDTIDSLNEDLANPGSPSHGQFTAVTRQADGLVQLQFSGVSGLSYIVEASSDLRTWEMIGVATPLGGGQFEFDDAQAGNFGQRFYRLVQP